MTAKYRAEHPDRVKAQRQRYLKAHREELNAKQREYRRKKYRSDPEYRAKTLAKNARWNKENKERWFAILRKSHRKYRGVLNPTGETKVGACPICDKVCNLQFDHDHKDGGHRGWLCSSCNRLLGWYERHAERIHSYLKKSSEEAAL